MYLRVFFDKSPNNNKYKFKDLDSAYEWLSTNVWSKFMLTSELPHLFKEEEFQKR